MEETTVTIDLGKDDIRIAATSVLEYLSIYPPMEDERNIEFNMGVSDALRHSEIYLLM